MLLILFKITILINNHHGGVFFSVFVLFLKGWGVIVDVVFKKDWKLCMLFSHDLPKICYIL